MRDQNLDFDDSVSQSGILMPATDKASTLENLSKKRGEVDVYDPQDTKNKSENSLSILEKLNRTLSRTPKE